MGETPGDVAPTVDDRLGYGGYTLWEVDGVPVALAGLTRRVAGTVRVAPVYTPPEHRRRGYAGAVTAEVSRAAMDADAREVLLFTDLANATSNALYQRLGYRPIANQLVLAFAADGSGRPRGIPELTLVERTSVVRRPGPLAGTDEHCVSPSGSRRAGPWCGGLGRRSPGR